MDNIKVDLVDFKNSKSTPDSRKTNGHFLMPNIFIEVSYTDFLRVSKLIDQDNERRIKSRNKMREDLEIKNCRGPRVSPIMYKQYFVNI